MAELAPEPGFLNQILKHYTLNSPELFSIKAKDMESERAHTAHTHTHTHMQFHPMTVLKNIYIQFYVTAGD